MVNIFPGFLSPNMCEGSAPVAPNSLEILSLLGYRNHQITDNLKALVRQDLWPYELETVESIRTQLNVIDGQIKDALEDSAVTQTCKTQMNWPAHIKMLRQQAHSLLYELARIYDIEVAHSKYSSYLGRVQHSIQYQ